MLAQAPANTLMIGEKSLRRQINLAVSRASVDGEFASVLLADPTVVLEGKGCPPQHYLALRNIHASGLVDFARQAIDLFWNAESLDFLAPSNVRHLNHEDRLQLAALAAH
jgi:hypothetical protein